MELLHQIESMRMPFFNTLFSLITRLGEETVAVAIICAIFWCINKKVAYGIGIAYFLSGLSVQCLKICFRIDRPWIIDPTLTPIPSAKVAATGYSFPSGHTQSATALFGSLGIYIKQIYVRAACFLLVFLIAFSRLYLGVHTLLDVAVSLCVSSLLVVAAVRFFSGDNIDFKSALLTAILMLAFALAVSITASVMFAFKEIEQEYVSDCLKAASAGAGFAAGMFVERLYIDFSVKTKSVLMQVIKFVAGMAGVLVIKEGLKLIIGTGLLVDSIRYFLLLTWVIAAYPLIIKRLSARFGASSDS